MTVERRVGATIDSALTRSGTMLNRIDYAIMLFLVAALMLIILLHTQLYGGDTTLRNFEPSPREEAGIGRGSTH
jgi:hypothetical protein